MPFDLTTIPLDAIDSEDRIYRISSSADAAWMDALVDSIERLGLLHPPLILKKHSQWQIVSGFRRIAACRRLGRDQLICRQLGSENPTHQAIQMAVAENAWQRPLNLMEKARAFVLLQQLYSDPEHLADGATPLGLVENPAIIDKLIRLTHLPIPVQQAVDTGLLGLAMALTLGTLATEDGRQILELFETFNLGLNRQRELLELIREIAKRESITIGRVLASDEIIAILNRFDQDRPARGGALRRYLKKRRYPVLTETETEFTRLERKLGLGPRVRMVPPPYFEGRTYQVNMKFDTLNELIAHHRMMAEMVRHPDLEAFLNR